MAEYRNFLNTIFALDDIHSSLNVEKLPTKDGWSKPVCFRGVEKIMNFGWEDRGNIIKTF